MHTLDKQLTLYTALHDAGYLTNFSDVNEMTETEVNEMISNNTRSN